MTRRELTQHILQLLEVVFREAQVLRIVPIAIERAEAENDANPADRAFGGILSGGLGEDLFYELANAADALLPTIQKL